MAIDKSKWDLKTKVSQKTIDDIKKMGMTAALKSVKGAVASSKDDSSAKAFAEGVRRLYGDTRFQNAVYTPKNSPGPEAPKKTAPRGAMNPRGM
jgi:hypothetical protein